MATNFGQNLRNDLHSECWHYKMVCTIVLLMRSLIAPLIALHREKIVKIGSVVFELKWGTKMKIVLRLNQNWPISPNISTTSEPVFTNVSALIYVYVRIIKLT